MGTTFTIILLIAIARCIRGHPHSGELAFMGSSTSYAPDASVKGGMMMMNSIYYKSINLVLWEEAAQECQNRLGENATFLAIETEDELESVRKSLETPDTASLYWIGGRYNTTSKSFVWRNGVPFGAWTPWALNYPDSRTPSTSVELFTVGGLTFRTQFNTVSRRYICELRAEVPDPCMTDNDLVVVLDSSRNVNLLDYRASLDFAANLARAWGLNPRNRLSVYVYSNQAVRIIALDEELAVEETETRIRAAPYLKQSTNSDDALYAAMNEYLLNPRPVPQNLVFITEGISDNPELTRYAATLVQQAGIRGFAVGVTGYAYEEELLAIAGNNPSRVFMLDGLDKLLMSLKEISRQVCT